MIELSAKSDSKPAAELRRRLRQAARLFNDTFVSLVAHCRFPQAALRADSTDRLSVLSDTELANLFRTACASTWNTGVDIARCMKTRTP